MMQNTQSISSSTVPNLSMIDVLSIGNINYKLLENLPTVLAETLLFRNTSFRQMKTPEFLIFWCCNSFYLFIYLFIYSKLLPSIIFRNIFISVEEAYYMENYLKATGKGQLLRFFALNTP